MKKLLIVLILFFSFTAYTQTAEEYYEKGLISKEDYFKIVRENT